MQAAGTFNDRAGYARDHCEREQLPEARAPSASRPRAEVCVQRLTTALISARGQPLDEQERARAHGTGRLKTKADELSALLIDQVPVFVDLPNFTGDRGRQRRPRRLG